MRLGDVAEDDAEELWDDGSFSAGGLTERSCASGLGSGRLGSGRSDAAASRRLRSQGASSGRGPAGSRGAVCCAHASAHCSARGDRRRGRPRERPEARSSTYAISTGKRRAPTKMGGGQLK